MSTPPAAPLRIALVGDHDPHITAHRAPWKGSATKAAT
ncbi:hypothetical protein T6L40_24285, partial [Pseudomonas aeruginosa]|nr:hypothetical protein [Pseudomonas aeruginosa]